MQLMLDMQAKHDAAIQEILAAQTRLEIAQAKHEIAMQQTDGRIKSLVDVCMSLAHHGEETDRRIRELSEETNRRFQEVSQRFQETDYKLNALIDTVDKLTKRNGSH